MDTVTLVLFLLVAVVVSGIISRMVPLPIPRPLVQIALGGVIGLAADLRVELDPEIFFLLFLPPLLFLDGWRIPKDEMLKDRATILELALGLVVITVLGVGLFIHWLVPAMPMAVAFALAAVVSPTDPIAVSAITARVPIPKRMMHVLEGESLLNDASGLVCLRFAVAAALTGTFSLANAALSFLWLAFGGIAIGVGVTWLIARGKNWVTHRYGEESGSQILISLLIPFAAYLTAEYFHCSGILAAVAAGVTMSFVEATGVAAAATRIRRNTVWDTIQFTANGIIFVLLGEQMPVILAGARETVALTGHDSPWWLVGYVLAIYVGLAALRFACVWISYRLTWFRKRRGESGPATPNARLVVVTSLAGVRGAITLAGVLTLPLALNDGTPFPARDLAIFLAAGVIIVSLIVASIALPLLLKGLELPPEASRHAEEERARVLTAEAAIAEIDRLQNAWSEGQQDADLYVAPAARLMDAYRARIEARASASETSDLARQSATIERRLWLAALRAERAALLKMVRKRELGGELARKLMREVDLMETRYSI